jgi:hypothetical protein
MKKIPTRPSWIFQKNLTKEQEIILDEYLNWFWGDFS